MQGAITVMVIMATAMVGTMATTDIIIIGDITPRVTAMDIMAVVMPFLIMATDIASLITADTAIIRDITQDIIPVITGTDITITTIATTVPRARLLAVLPGR
jgi:hypothetical protein